MVALRDMTNNMLIINHYAAHIIFAYFNLKFAYGIVYGM